MKIYEVVSTKEMLRGELIENYYAVFEETEHKDLKIKDGYWVEKDCRIRMDLIIYKGNPSSSLLRLKTYTIESVNLKDIRAMIMNDFPALFIDCQFSRKAV